MINPMINHSLTIDGILSIQQPSMGINGLTVIAMVRQATPSETGHGPADLPPPTRTDAHTHTFMYIICFYTYVHVYVCHFMCNFWYMNT